MAKTFDDYAADLEKLIEAARQAILAGDDTRMKSSHGDLGAFIADSNDRVDGVLELDSVASNTMRDITLARLDQSLVKNLSDRSADVARLAKTFTNQAATNSSAASALRLERAKALLGAGVTVVDELRKFADTVDTSTPDGKKLAKALNGAVAAVLAVQRQVAG